MNRRLASWLTAMSLASLLAACTQPVSPPPPVPLPQVETMPLPPISPVELVWRPGSWNWDGSGYRWTPGDYEPRTARTNLWRMGYWAQTPGGWVWQPPGWV